MSAQQPTAEQLQGVMLLVADPAYFDALRRGETGADALCAAVKATMAACLSGHIPEHKTGDPIVIRRYDAEREEGNGKAA